ncbi:hypothetical protein [Streptomyces sp. RK62]|uniref:hypothetical protein n=1 Tax=Streptomyces sp. RK62 TaxID=2824893 RepID=UPI001B38EF6A|nr:hypothetical protein [Streptomyces sp. RK62]MBQ0998666.1 hypothetical protein [Streptomyces sp. RK62]
MRPSRRRAAGTPSGLRGRPLLLVAVLLIVGSEWVQRPLSEHYWELYLESGEQPWLLSVASLPAWGYDPDHYAGGFWYLVGNDLRVLALIAGIVLVPARLPARIPAWLRHIVGAVLVAVVLQTLLWSLPQLFRPEEYRFDQSAPVLWQLLRQGLVFGVATGVVLALLAAAPSVTVPSPGARPAPARRNREGGTGMTTGPVHMPVGREPGDVTRYLCTAAYVDEQFADRVVEEVLADEAGAVAPSPDVDLVSVVRHCLTARDLRQQRDLRLTCAFALVAVLAPLWLLFSMVLLSTARRTGGRPSHATRGHHQPESRVLIGTGLSAVVMVFVAFYFGYGISAAPVSGFPAWLLGAYGGGVPAVLASIAAVAFACATVVRHDLAVDGLLRTTMTREAFPHRPRPTVPRHKWIADRLTAIREAQSGNVTVYSGYTPFVGYAGTDSKWSIAVPLLPADDSAGVKARPAEPEPFTVTDLVDHVRQRLRTVAERGAVDGAADEGADALRSLFVEDRVFASGTAIGDDDRFTSGTALAPVARLSPPEVDRIIERPSGAVRHYLAVHVPLWGGDVVPSVFLHFSTAGRTLHLHCDNHVLGPVRADYHVVDRLRGELRDDARRGLLVTSLSRTGPAFLAAPFRAVRYARFETRHHKRMMDELKAMEQDPVFDFGARVSVREMALSPDYHNYFQVVDAGRITALVERHALAALREFLDSRGYDITDFRAQQQTILNQGVIQQGGMSIVGNQAVGAGASANQTVPRQTGPAAVSGTDGSEK